MYQMIREHLATCPHPDVRDWLCETVDTIHDSLGEEAAVAFIRYVLGPDDEEPESTPAPLLIRGIAYLHALREEGMINISLN